MVNGLDEGIHFGSGELMRLVVVSEEVTETFHIVLCARASGFQLRLQAGEERLSHHVADDFAWGVERASLFACGGTGLRVVGGEQVLEDLAEQFGVERDFLLDGGVFSDGELVAVEGVDEAADLALR